MSKVHFCCTNKMTLTQTILAQDNSELCMFSTSCGMLLVSVLSRHVNPEKPDSTFFSWSLRTSQLSSKKRFLLF